MILFANSIPVIYSTEWNNYREIDERSRLGHTRKCIDGQITGSNKCVGYCKYNGHPGFLTKELRKGHNCIKKECHYYISKSKRQELSVFATVNR